MVPLPEANLASLPLELKVKLFRMLVDYSDALSLTQVNKEWRKIGDDSRNWKVTEMTLSAIPWKSVENILTKPERTIQLRTMIFEKMISDGNEEGIIRMLAEYGQISQLTLLKCSLFSTSLETEEILGKSSKKFDECHTCL